MPQNMFFCQASKVSGNRSYLHRESIHTLLEQAIQKPAVTIIAGTGFGKTQTVYSFLQGSDIITTWMQLTSLDNISMRFWANLVNVVSLHSKKMASSMGKIGFPDTSAKINMFVSVLMTGYAAKKKHVAVLDDFHLISERRILLLIENIIHACIPNLSIILISRNEPEINLADLLVKDMVFAISEDDLRFHINDLHRYFEAQGIHAPPRALLKIHENTNGWIFAIRMIELSIKRGAPHEEYAIEAMRINIFKLIEQKCFSDIPQEVQLFFVKLSLFQSLPAELVRLLSRDDEQLIHEILKINAFVRYDSFANIYYIHQLFLEFLQQKHDMLTLEEKKECYRSAADWYDLNGYKVDAVNYYGQAGEYEKFLDVMLDFPHVLPEEVAALIIDIVDNAAAEALEKQPLLIVLRARADSRVGKGGKAMADLAALKQKHEALPPTLQNRSLLCEIHITEAIFNYLTCIFTNDFRFLDLFIKAYEYMPEGSAILKGRNNNHEIGAYVCRVGDSKKQTMDAYIAAVTAAVPYASNVLYGYMFGADDLAKAELAYFRNEMKSADSLAYQAVYKARKKGQYEIENRALFYLLRIAISLGDYTRIKDILDQLDVQNKVKFPDQKMLYDIVISWFYSAIRQGDSVSSWIKSNFVKSNVGLLASGNGSLSTMKYNLSEKRYDEHLHFMENEENIAGIAGFLFGKIALPIHKAVCLYHTGRQEEALAFLQEAYTLAEPNGLTMQFIEMGNDMVALAKFALKHEGCAIPHEWLKDICRKSSTYAKRISHIALEYKKSNQLETDPQIQLTKKELEILTELCHGLSIAEIAENRSISKNYVNNRLQNVYAKLGAQNIKDAIHIATLMKIVT